MLLQNICWAILLSILDTDNLYMNKQSLIVGGEYAAAIFSLCEYSIKHDMFSPSPL